MTDSKKRYCGLFKGAKNMGKMQRRKGYRVEHEIEQMFRQMGINARRVPLSGSADFVKGDVQIVLKNKILTAEVKARKDGFRQIYNWLDNKDLLIIKADRKEPLVVLRLKNCIEFLKEGK